MGLSVEHPSVPPPAPVPARLGRWAASSGAAPRRPSKGGASSPLLTDEETEAESGEVPAQGHAADRHGLALALIVSGQYGWNLILNL